MDDTQECREALFQDQLITDGGRGDCLRASVGSILGIPLSEIPNFAEYDFFDTLCRWLDERGLRLLSVSYAQDSAMDRLYVDDREELVLLWGTSPRSTAEKRKQHCVVGRSKGYGFEIIHDPHPDKTGLIGIPDGAAWILPKTSHTTRSNLDADKLRDIIKDISIAHSMSHTEWCDSSYWKDEHERLVTILDALIKDLEK